MNNGKKLRDLIKNEKIVIAPGAHDALTAKIIEKTGFKALYMTGYGQAASHLGSPDVGLISFTEMVDRARNMVDAVDIPVIADADTGFGNAVNVIRTVKAYERAGVAAIQLEDQVAPKRCGHMLGREVISAEQMIGKIKAAVDTRQNKDFMVMARTDARTVLGLEEALKRGKAYEDAGADIIFIESVESEEEMKEVHKVIKKAVTIANMVEGGRTPLLTNDKLAEIGYKIVIYPTASTYVTTKAMFDLMEDLKANGTTAGYIKHMVPFEDFNKLLGLPEINDLGEKYGANLPSCNSNNK